MDTIIQSTVDDIINTSLNETADDLELNFYTQSLTKTVFDEALKELQIEDIKHLAEVIDKSEGDSFELKDKKLAKELLQIYDENGKFIGSSKKSTVKKKLEPAVCSLKKTPFMI